MTQPKYQARHRKVRRPVMPIEVLTDTVTSLNLSSSRSTAVASVTGLALTAVVGGAANAAPAQQVGEAAVNPATVTATHAPATVAVPDIAWTAADEVSASAEAPTVQAPETTAEQSVEAASRDSVRADVAQQAATARAVAANAAGGDIVSIAMSLVGSPYVYGGNSPAGFDCSGFTQYVYGLAGIGIPRTSGAQGAAGTKVSYAEAKPGDLVWHAYGHVGIYAGNGMVIEATVPGTTVTLQPIWGYDSFVRY
ncbi:MULTISPECIES: C40 family peptidase [unclassified Schaalia]|uniref:C40 family peptidase n=1 Tax=unclassified Schaalia TaxID=2691889 RepID=UPI001E3C5DFB|nr:MULTISPECIES: C40 family peptidase [unclassified Schaalia]MCD4548997.1 NlpC/P60 family protein [Schaalia sp. lx-260]MCD4557608.1 NlpC/P60 family protein [Schaalia sp. lx-100]